MIYASDYDAPHERHEHRRAFTPWVEEHAPEWRLLEKIENPYPYNSTTSEDTSLSDFYIYERRPTESDTG